MYCTCLLEIENYCAANPAEACAGTCAAPAEFSHKMGAQVTLNCEQGYATSDGSSSFVTTCNAASDESGSWNVGGGCTGIAFWQILI